MRSDVNLPQWGMGMTEGTVVQWLKTEGEEVAEGEDLVEIDSGKTQDFVTAPVAGILSKIHVAEDETVPCGALLATITASGRSL